MVPVRLLINTATRRAALLLPPFLALAVCPATLRAQTFATNITVTTYIDSRVSNQTNNYGNAHTVKVVVDNNVTSDGSVCRGLLQFPPQLWSYSPADIVTATVSFYVWQDNTVDRNVTLFPLTHSFVQGTGYGTCPPDGATWFTCDGVNPWSSPGGDVDMNFSSIAVKGPVLSDENDRFFTWDITALLQHPTSRAELQRYGAMLRIDETPIPASGMPRAPFTSVYDPAYTPAYWPSVQLSVQPTLLNATISNGAISFSLTNLTVGVTNTIERTFNLSNNTWTGVFSFVATGITTNWSDSIQPGWTNAFYRVHTQF
ncbi:MAG TPA: hypothetical protein VMP11_01095 [Verrucomicrobiae bacterium]|nr:hypothetical protein [Verrucomicrobiae bacterium]